MDRGPRARRRRLDQAAAIHGRTSAASALASATAALGLSASALGRHLDMAPRTARRIVAQGHSCAPLPPLGRPPLVLPSEDRAKALELLKAEPLLGMPMLKLALPNAPHNALAELIFRARYAQRRRRKKPSKLNWHEAGIAWAIDATHFEAVDGLNRQLIVVRDLHSRKILATRPVMCAAQTDTVPLLRDLFERHGAPMILKSDNGGAFAGDAVAAFLTEQDVAPLISPPACPSYNGGIERTIGCLHQLMDRCVALPSNTPWHPANLTATLEYLDSRRPRGRGGKTVRQLWDQRVPIRPNDRERFLAEVALINEATCKTQHDLATNQRRRTDAEIKRAAISAAAQRLNYLSIIEGR